MPSFVGRSLEHMRAILLHIVRPIRAGRLFNQRRGGQVASKESEPRMLTKSHHMRMHKVI